MATTNQIRTETVRKLQLHEGDIVHVQVGGDIQVSGGSTVTWIPTQADLEEAFLNWAPLMVEHKNSLIVTHHLVEPMILSSKLNLSTWPPKVKP